VPSQLSGLATGITGFGGAILIQVVWRMGEDLLGVDLGHSATNSSELSSAAESARRVLAIAAVASCVNYLAIAPTVLAGRHYRRDVTAYIFPGLNGLVWLGTLAAVALKQDLLVRVLGGFLVLIAVWQFVAGNVLTRAKDDDAVTTVAMANLGLTSTGVSQSVSSRGSSGSGAGSVEMSPIPARQAPPTATVAAPVKLGSVRSSSYTGGVGIAAPSPLPAPYTAAGALERIPDGDSDGDGDAPVSVSPLQCGGRRLSQASSAGSTGASPVVPARPLARVAGTTTAAPPGGAQLPALMHSHTHAHALALAPALSSGSFPGGLASAATTAPSSRRGSPLSAEEAPAGTAAASAVPPALAAAATAVSSVAAPVEGRVTVAGSGAGSAARAHSHQQLPSVRKAGGYTQHTDDGDDSDDTATSSASASAPASASASALVDIEAPVLSDADAAAAAAGAAAPLPVRARALVSSCIAHVRAHPVDAALGLLTGSAAGFLGGAFGINGPPIVMFVTYMKLDGTAVRDTCSLIFLLNLPFLIAARLVYNIFRAEEWLVYLLAVPVLVGSLKLGNWLHYVLPSRAIFLGLQVLILLSSIPMTKPGSGPFGVIAAIVYGLIGVGVAAFVVWRVRRNKRIRAEVSEQYGSAALTGARIDFTV
jgi:uncharacterized membrane protein YfcA